MITFKDLQKQTGYTADQLRDRLGRLGEVLDHDRQRGPNNSILVGDTTRAVLMRLKELEGSGVSAQTAVDRLVEEIQNLEANGPKPNPRPTETAPQTDPDVPAPTPELLQALERIEDLKDRIADLKADKEKFVQDAAWYRDQLQAALPASSEGRRRLSLRERLRGWVG